MGAYNLAVVEDSPVEGKLYERNLGDRGHNVHCFASGEGFFDSLRSDEPQYDLIVLDYMLHNDITGFMIFEKLLEQELDIPVILITSFGSINLVKIFMQKGGSDFVEKPISDWEYLNQRILKAISEHEKKIQLEELKQRTYDLEMSQRAKDAFFDIVSHELKGPMSVVLGNVDIAMTMIDHECFKGGPGAMECLKTAKTYSNRLSAILTSLLIALGAKNGNDQENFIKVDLLTILQQVVYDYQKNFLDKGCVLNFVPRGTCLVEIDPDRLFQVLFNLMDNSFKYSGKKQVDLVCEVDNDKSLARILVCDDGVGINEKELFSVFEQFTRVGSNPKIAGSGLGLFIAKKMVNSMNGDIWVKSRSNEGCTFGFEFKQVDERAKIISDSIKHVIEGGLLN